MKKMMFILMIMTAFLASNTLAVAPDDITNPSFEDQTGGVCDFWTLWSGGGATDSIYHDGDAANAHTGDAYFEVGNGGAGWSGIHTDLGQEVAVTPGTQAEMLFWAKSADGGTHVDSVLFKFEWYATQSEGWADGLFAELAVTTTGSYEMFSVVAEVPAGMNFARATVVSTGVAQVYVDDVWVGVAGEYTGGATPTSPSPKNGSIQSVKNVPSYGYIPVTDLSWINPDPAVDSTVGGAANLGVEVKFGIGVTDPNFPGGFSYSVAKGTGSAFETVALDTDLGVTLPLADDTNYYWQVTITDANSAGDQVTSGNVWSFETGDALPNVETVVDQYMWLDQADGDGDSTIRTFTVTSTYTDDGKSPIVDANFTTNDWLWANDQAGVIEVSDVHTPDPAGPSGTQSGTVVATYKTVALGDDPLRPTEETTIPGWWNIGLEVTDSGSRTTSGNTGYNYVGETCGQAAAAGGDDAFELAIGAYDVNNDCILNLVDFSDLAAVWLDASPKKE
jgi:hypothetical protein